jgi:hypothetical protein
VEDEGIDEKKHQWRVEKMSSFRENECGRGDELCIQTIIISIIINKKIKISHMFINR